jgi:hypothetical protein
LEAVNDGWKRAGERRRGGAEEWGSGGAEERRSRGAEERRSRGAEERRSGGAEERRSRGADEQRANTEWTSTKGSFQNQLYEIDYLLGTIKELEYPTHSFLLKLCVERGVEERTDDGRTQNGHQQKVLIRTNYMKLIISGERLRSLSIQLTLFYWNFALKDEWRSGQMTGEHRMDINKRFFSEPIIWNLFLGND